MQKCHHEQLINSNLTSFYNWFKISTTHLTKILKKLITIQKYRFKKKSAKFWKIININFIKLKKNKWNRYKIKKKIIERPKVVEVLFMFVI